MNNNQQLILQALRFENISSREIARVTGISQTTVSRNLQDLPVVKLGNARSSVFAAITPNQAWSVV
ncbi:MAG: winged helix-turn-helix transcriptional regulator [Thiomicrospira sp.]|uniref:winged helix-turn-helix transcriptional regulator n=1 Tax=Thiomicrospira sp. TaxID=935 RepID=UPI001A00366B|nr:winged helix-turn-helix domain-containing protein [Thiomicrospira sp.]MBE0494411.1 winged helix-turn-helix transcriptional regulator [Thiomicrospira sp.]